MLTRFDSEQERHRGQPVRPAEALGKSPPVEYFKAHGPDATLRVTVKVKFLSWLIFIDLAGFLFAKCSD
jgi:hypothetical protein